MKKIILGTLCVLSALSAQAHPLDSDDFELVGIGSQVKVVASLNFKPGFSHIPFHRRATRDYGLSCSLQLKKADDFDRVLRKGRKLKVTRVSTTLIPFEAYDVTEVLTTLHFENDSTVKSLTCSRENYAADGIGMWSSRLTIGEAKRVLEAKLEIVLAEPVEI